VLLFENETVCDSGECYESSKTEVGTGKVLVSLFSFVLLYNLTCGSIDLCRLRSGTWHQPQEKLYMS